MTRDRDQSLTPLEQSWPLERWPDVPTRFLLCRDDRFFPAEFQRRVVPDRLGIPLTRYPADTSSPSAARSSSPTASRHAGPNCFDDRRLHHVVID